MRKDRLVWLAFSSLMILALACNLPNRIAKEIGGQIEQKIEAQLREALEAAGSEELMEDLKGIAEEFTGQNLGELMNGFSAGDWSRVDVPLPPDARIMAGSSAESQGDFILLETSMSIDEAEAWMLAMLKENGWTQGELNVQMDLARVFDFSKGDEKLGLVINGNLMKEGTNISITVYR